MSREWSSPESYESSLVVWCILIVFAELLLVLFYFAPSGLEYYVSIRPFQRLFRLREQTEAYLWSALLAFLRGPCVTSEGPVL